MAMNNDTCVKSYIAPQAYKIVSTNSHELSGWTILSRLLHSRAVWFLFQDVLTKTPKTLLEYDHLDHFISMLKFPPLLALKLFVKVMLLRISLSKVINAEDIIITT